ncbi:MAG TPA: hypothetical protein VF169_23735 [Albitalea sp.]|uniref:hypothetical protein n=1 Tax=Piscinibacter sp. TaxID=1903157 RepID=UPI002ED13B39
MRLRDSNAAIDAKGHTLGVEQPTASLSGMADLVAAQYQGLEGRIPSGASEMLDAFGGKAEALANAEARMLMARDMTLSEFRHDIERKQYIYPFVQVDDDGVPIEHAGLVASRWEGQTVTSVRGSLIHDYKVLNQRKPLPDRTLVDDALRRIEGLETFAGDPLDEAPSLVLLPSRRTDGGVSLEYAWRYRVRGNVQGRQVNLLLWVEPPDPVPPGPGGVNIQRFRPLELRSEVPARGRVWDSDPGTGRTPQRFFDVSGLKAGSAGPYTLTSGLVDKIVVRNRIEERVAVDKLTQGSNGSFVDFDTDPINDGFRAVCAGGGNYKFQQVHLYATLHLNWVQARAAGMHKDFPKEPWTVYLETAECSSYADMSFGACDGYFKKLCPDYSTNGEEAVNRMNFAHDNTIISHEFAHKAVQELTEARPPEWCGKAPCGQFQGWEHFHDLADAWADHFDNGNCVGGWVAKNVGGVNASYNCQGSRGHAWSSLPRLHEVSVPLNPASPGAHFPEHRAASPVADHDYADMQIASAALWQVREGLRSLDPTSGHPQYFVRLVRALKNTTLFGVDPGNHDLGMYEYLYDLEQELVEQWAMPKVDLQHSSDRQFRDASVNKVLAGFAKAGLFLVPSECLDGDRETNGTLACAKGDKGIDANGDNGGDAVIDVDDGVAADDLTSDGVLFPEHDYVALEGSIPTFHVWTGPRYRFRNTAATPISATAPCNARFRVEISTDKTFGSASVRSDWIPVNTRNDLGSAPACYGTWTPPERDWQCFHNSTPGTKLYYRAITANADGNNVRDSTKPGAGLWVAPPPYAVLTRTGKPDL